MLKKKKDELSYTVGFHGELLIVKRLNHAGFLCIGALCLGKRHLSHIPMSHIYFMSNIFYVGVELIQCVINLITFRVANVKYALRITFTGIK